MYSFICWSYGNNFIFLTRAFTQLKGQLPRISSVFHCIFHTQMVGTHPRLPVCSLVSASNAHTFLLSLILGSRMSFIVLLLPVHVDELLCEAVFSSHPDGLVLLVGYFFYVAPTVGDAYESLKLTENKRTMKHMLV